MTDDWVDPAPHKSGFVDANGIKMHYLDWGGDGPALILIHGFGDSPHIFDDLASAFCDEFRVIAYTRRGHGQRNRTMEKHWQKIFVVSWMDWG